MVLQEDLLHRYLMGECSDEERVKVLLWTEEDPQNMRTLQHLSDLYNATIWLDQTSGKRDDRETDDIGNKNTVKKGQRRISLRVSYLKYASIAAVLFIALFTTNKFLKNRPETSLQTITVPEGQRAVIELSDGTVVTLNSNTKLTYKTPFTGSTRDVHLDGEAYFKVAHDAGHPFIVTASGYDVKVLGTEFNIKSYSHDGYEVALINGSVSMKGAGTKETILKPGHRLYYSKDKCRIVEDKIEHSEYFDWTRGQLSFNDQTLRDILENAETLYGVKIVCMNEDALNQRFTGKILISDGIGQLLNVLSTNGMFNYDINEDNKQIVIK